MRAVPDAPGTPLKSPSGQPIAKHATARRPERGWRRHDPRFQHARRAGQWLGRVARGIAAAPPRARPSDAPAGWRLVTGPSIRLHPLNLGERLRARFEHLFGVTGRGAGLLVNESVAEVVLVALDGPADEQRLAEYRRQYPGRPALILASVPLTAAAGDQVLLKPVEIRSLLVALKQLREVVDRLPAASMEHDRERLGTERADIEAGVTEDSDVDPPTMVLPRRVVEAVGARQVDVEPGGDDEPVTLVNPRCAPTDEATVVDNPVDEPATEPWNAAIELEADTQELSHWAEACGTGEDVDPESEEAVAGLWLNADGLLLPRLASAARQALDAQRVLELRAGTLKIVLDGASDYAYADNDDATVQALCAAGPVAGNMTVAPAGKPKAVLLSRGGNPTAYWSTVESAVWQTAVWTYRGRLPAGTSLTERVYLARWPNFTRLVALPHALRIAALWVEQPMSLAATASLLGVPQRFVFAFYGAAHALGLSGPAQRSADHLFETPPALVVPRRPLLGRLVRHLRTRTAATDTPRSRATG